ncbi:sigma-70 family RNA polymerase sigma factor [Psychrobacillus sp. OK032]|uniref:sigma-70 family RNA polymerase sigma factor n=1 Tax=Psychrobacillus sp. OK032 TaxID=1884358 RepID=UPI0008D787B0|nr:sigma-70 family RNA polymerase sigma factor [Psychrobacillus sp. OK032]SES10480.1 RNA polymerase sigma factor, sigma-70 family [Psychrobacillus sp. OK032]
MNSEKQKIIQEFLKCPSNLTLFEEFKTTNSEEIKQKIDLRFKKHYQNYRIISYLIKVLHYESKHFDRKMRTYKDRYQLILTNNLDLSPIFLERSYSDSIGFSEDIIDHIASHKLFNCLRKLTDRQKEILSLVYVKQMTDKEIAQYLGITQQAVSKTRKNIIKKVRKEITHD